MPGAGGAMRCSDVSNAGRIRFACSELFRWPLDVGPRSQLRLAKRSPPKPSGAKVRSSADRSAGAATLEHRLPSATATVVASPVDSAVMGAAPPGDSEVVSAALALRPLPKAILHQAFPLLGLEGHLAGPVSCPHPRALLAALAAPALQLVLLVLGELRASVRHQLALPTPALEASLHHQVLPALALEGLLAVPVSAPHPWGLLTPALAALLQPRADRSTPGSRATTLA